jgi:hypothetical protein
MVFHFTMSRADGQNFNSFPAQGEENSARSEAAAVVEFQWERVCIETDIAVAIRFVTTHKKNSMV